MQKIKFLIINGIASNIIFTSKIRGKLYSLMGINISKNANVKPRCFFNSLNVKIGKNSFINSYCQFHSVNEKNNIEIGDNCYVGMNVNFCCISHEIGNSNLRAGNNIYKPIKVNDGTWIGANTTILQGVTVGNGCIIAAGSVVIKDCEPNCMYAGNPARKIKELD